MTTQNQIASARAGTHNDNDSNLNDDVSWLFECLNSCARRPMWLSSEWKQAQECDENSTEKIFQIDFATWMIYRNAKAKAFGQVHYSGRAALRDKIQQLEDESADRKLEIAQKVHRTMDHGLRQRIMNWEDKTHGRKRLPHHQATPTRELLPPSPQPLAFIQTTQAAPAAPVLARQLLADMRNDDTLLDAYISETKKLLPGYLFDALIKRHSAARTTMSAGITMTYFFHSDDCHMMLEIMNSKVERIAHQLFGVQLEIESGIRYAVFGMAKVTPIPQLVLEGCHPESIEPMFGQVVSRAVQAGSVYQHDATTLSEHTQAVSMLISRKADDAATLVIRMALLEGIEIAVQLFRLGRTNCA
ncbi:hypothetical protein GGR52DRAFT_192825 [Hypoxylon sp. FL1284]|nr:hypothetical protein GGR52DRAFT_192825 [Hypoxylon sp. FL1284]